MLDVRSCHKRQNMPEALFVLKLFINSLMQLSRELRVDARIECAGWTLAR